MPEPLKCHSCGANATVHLTQILNNQIHKVDLCEACAQKKGVLSSDGFILADLVSKKFGQENMFEKEGQQALIECKNCGLSLSELKKTGRLGCAYCYDNLENILEPIIKKLHKDKTHVGKVPKITPSEQKMEQVLLDLKEKIKTAIKEERYEDAAKLRDQITKIQYTS